MHSTHLSVLLSDFNVNGKLKSSPFCVSLVEKTTVLVQNSAENTFQRYLLFLEILFDSALDVFA